MFAISGLGSREKTDSVYVQKIKDDPLFPQWQALKGATSDPKKMDEIYSLIIAFQQRLDGKLHQEGRYL